MFSDDQLLPISALQHYLFCPRQTALIHLEGEWVENQFTAEGAVIHNRAHDGHDESRPGVRITRSLPVVSHQLGFAGQCDIVEFHDDGRVVPVEYKRGQPKAHDADLVQVCAQAVCLEEMLSIQVDEAFLFYGKRKRRTKVELDSGLRRRTEAAASDLHELIRSSSTPEAVYESKKCDSCSLIHQCQPHAFRLKRGAAAWFESSIANPLDNSG